MKVKLMFALILIGINAIFLFFALKIWLLWVIFSGIMSTIIHIIQNRDLGDYKNFMFGMFLTVLFGWVGLPYYAIYYFVWGKDDED